jgi:hypothetical protein
VESVLFLDKNGSLLNFPPQSVTCGVNIAESDNRKIIEREKGLAIFGWIDRNAPFFEVNETYVSSNTSTSKVQYFTSPWTAGGKPNSQTNSPYDCEADKNMAQSTAKSVFLFLHFICWELIVRGEMRTSVMGRLGRGWQKKSAKGRVSENRNDDSFKSKM